MNIRLHTHTYTMTYLPIISFELAHPVIILVVMEVIRCQRCLRKRALKAKLYRSLQRTKTDRGTLDLNTCFDKEHVSHQQDDTSYFNQMTQSVKTTVKLLSVDLSAMLGLLTLPC